MKSLLLTITLAALLLMSPLYAAAQENAEPTPTEAESQNLDDTIKSLKEKIEDKVEEINKSSKSIIKGIVGSISDQTIELNVGNSASYTVALDDTISSYYSASLEGRETIEATDIEEGDYLLITGPVIEDQVSANTIYRQTRYDVFHGQITALDSGAFTIDVVTQEKDEYTLDIEDDTTQLIMNSKTLALEKAGFSKFKVGDNIHFVAEISDEDATRITAIRTLIIPQEYFVDPDESTPSAEEE